jgi:hypothetical protein
MHDAVRRLAAEQDQPASEIAHELLEIALGRQGHRPKIRAAFDALERDGLLLPHLRPSARFRVVIDWLMAAGYAKDLSERDAVEREYKRWLRERSSAKSAQGAQDAPLAPQAA